MNNSKAETQAVVDANNCTTFDEAADCARLQTGWMYVLPPVRPLPERIWVVPVLPNHHWKEPYRRVCHKNERIARVLGKLVTRYLSGHESDKLLVRDWLHWWAFKRDDLADEADLNPKQIDYAISKLVEWGIVLTRKNGAKVKGVKHSLFRLNIAQGSAFLNGWPTFAECLTESLAISENQDTAISEKWEIKTYTPLEEPLKSKALNSDSQALPETLDANQCDQAKATGEENSKTDSPSTPTPNAVEKKIFEILPSTYTPNDWVEMFSATGAAVTAHERGRLVAMGDRYERAGKPFAPFLKALLNTHVLGHYADWGKYRQAVLDGTKVDKSDRHNPATHVPHVDFFLRRHEALYAQYRQWELGEGLSMIGWQPPPPAIKAPPAPVKPVELSTFQKLVQDKIAAKTKHAQAAAA
ncbi:hypothetical protein [Paraburkholderia sp. D1E]|uniref:hypothetical protein n=1 Tax=Paraburkholderia sp. D1E TaxID=3461398 RepID=UPI004045C7A0